MAAYRHQGLGASGQTTNWVGLQLHPDRLPDRLSRQTAKDFLSPQKPQDVPLDVVLPTKGTGPTSIHQWADTRPALQALQPLDQLLPPGGRHRAKENHNPTAYWPSLPIAGQTLLWGQLGPGHELWDTLNSIPNCARIQPPTPEVWHQSSGIPGACSQTPAPGFACGGKQPWILLNPDTTHRWASSSLRAPWGPAASHLVTWLHHPVAGSLCTRQGLVTNQTRGQPSLQTAHKVSLPQQHDPCSSPRRNP